MPRSKPKIQGGNVGKILLAVLLFLALAVGFVFFSSDKHDMPSKKTEAAKPEAKVKAEAVMERTPRVKPKANAASTAPEPPKEVWMGHEIVKTSVKTNGTDLIITRIDKDGKVHKEYTNTRRRLFTNPVDIVLSILLTTPEGAPVPPLPPLGPRSDDIFGAALRTPIEVTDEDSEEDAKIKRLVKAAREEMLQELAAGRTVNEVIEDHCTYVDANNTLRAEAMVQYKKLIEEGDAEMAEEYRKKVNALLSEKGATTIRSPEEIRKLRKPHVSE